MSGLQHCSRRMHTNRHSVSRDTFVNQGEALPVLLDNLPFQLSRLLTPSGLRLTAFGEQSPSVAAGNRSAAKVVQHNLDPAGSRGRWANLQRARPGRARAPTTGQAAQQLRSLAQTDPLRRVAAGQPRQDYETLAIPLIRDWLIGGAGAGGLKTHAKGRHTGPPFGPKSIDTPATSATRVTLTPAPPRFI